MALRIVPFAEIGADAWDEYVGRSARGWFWHLRGWTEYQLAFSPGGVDASAAAVGDDGDVLGVAPATLPTFGGGPQPFPIASRKGVYDALVDHIHSQVWTPGEGSCTPIDLADHPFGPGAPVVTARRGPVEQGVRQHRLIDLSLLDWSKVRKSYHSLVNRARREYRIGYHHGDAAFTDTGRGCAFARYQEIHRRLTAHPRPDATYRWQARWLEQGRAAVAVAEDPSGVVWGASYWYVYKQKAYYGSGAYAARDGVSHALVWEALHGLRRRGVEVADMGQQGTAITGKESAIEFFKRGWGGWDADARTARLMP